uniref:Uncharacterized protein n=1 Tax=Setaria italica TaxID=4555 RepID=K3ZPA7_SETIT
MSTFESAKSYLFAYDVRSAKQIVISSLVMIKPEVIILLVLVCFMSALWFRLHCFY